MWQQLQPLLPLLLLVLSNTFMMFAWYGHLKYTHAPIYIVIAVSWAIALLEYCFAVPANRLGYQYYSVAELKTFQEIITITVFVGFSMLFLGEKITLHHLAGFTFICVGAYIIFNAPK